MPERPIGNALRLALAVCAAASAIATPAAALEWAGDDGPPWSATVRPSIWRDGPKPESRAEVRLAERREPSAEPGGLSGKALALSVGLAVATVAAVTFALEPPRDTRWGDTNGFDRGLTDGLGGNSRGTRDRADLASDVLLGALGAAMVADWVWLRDEYGFWNSAGNDGIFILGNIATTQLLKFSTARERPLTDRCERRGSFAEACDGLGRDRNASFASGHASISGTLAGLVCARHLRRSTVRGRDWAACGAAASTSLATGMLRVTAFRHWGSDVLVGWASGVAFGYWLPTHFRYGTRRPIDVMVAPSAAPGFVGLNLSIAF